MDDKSEALDQLVAATSASELLDHVVLHSPAIAFFWELAEGWPVRFVSGNIEQFGYTAEEFESGRRSFASIVHPDDIDFVAAEVSNYLEAGRDRFNQRYRLIHADGHERWIDNWTYIQRGDNGEPLWAQGIVVDITELIESGERLQFVANNLAGALFEYTMFADGSDRIDYMSPGCESIWEVRNEAVQHDPTVLWGMVLEDDLQAMRESVQHSADSLTQWNHEWRIQTPSGSRKWLRGSGTPLRGSDGRTRWMTVILDCSAEKERSQAVSEALTHTIYVLAEAVEARDLYTAGHQKSVASIARKIGAELGLPSHRLTGLELGAMVHDVGKIQIPSEILNKPSRLTEPEFALIKTHSEAGARMLKDIEFEWPIAEMILQHHERMDGSGYPKGLKGDEILLEARIIAVADVLEAMASHRPYRPGLGIERACEELREGAGRRYDPDVVAACLSLVEQGRITL